MTTATSENNHKVTNKNTTCITVKKILSIEIKNYRSIKKQVLSDFKDLNIFSGGNDVGKSNILRALDLFFNDKTIDFYEEFSIDRRAEIRRQREKQIISIKIIFSNSEYTSTETYTIQRLYFMLSTSCK